MLGDKRVLITGAASGMGRGIAIEAARQGATQVGISDIDAQGLDVTRTLVEAEGATVYPLLADLRKGEEIKQMVDGFARRAGGLDTLINNAGVIDHQFTAADKTRIDELDEAAWDAVNDINLKAVWLGTKSAACYLLASARGPSVVNAASVAGMYGSPLAAYSATKAGVIQLTRTTAINLGPTVRANSFAPGTIRTPMSTAHLLAAAEEDRLETARRMYGAHLLPRMGEVEEVAGVVCFLASDEASFLTGINVPVDGGTMAWRGLKDVELPDLP